MSRRTPAPRHTATVALSRATLPALDPRIEVPRYHPGQLSPSIVHVGLGGFARAHLASYLHELAQAGITDWGLVGSGVLRRDGAMSAALQPQDHLYTLVERGPLDGHVRIIGSVTAHIHANDDFEPLIRALAGPMTRVVSLTITEAGYPVNDAGGFEPTSPQAGPRSAFAVIVRALRRRHDTGQPPLTVMSCDNIASNGDVARTALTGVAEQLDPKLVPWIERTVAFPNSMVDRITTATTDADRAWLAGAYGVRDRWPVVTEPFRQWVLEDRFADDRPPLERLDVILTSDVRPYEQVKLRLLNAAHSCLAYPAALLGYDQVDLAMRDPLLDRLVRRYLDQEAGPVVPTVPGIDLDEYRTTLIERFGNAAIADRVARLCQDGSAKLRTFLLPVVRDQLRAGGPIDVAALVVASWCVYLGGRREDGEVIELAPDPLLTDAKVHASVAEEQPAAFLQLRSVFGDLADDERFVTAFAEALDRLRSAGLRAAVEAIVGPAPL